MLVMNEPSSRSAAGAGWRRPSTTVFMPMFVPIQMRPV
jgi:hypothetical protein